MPIARSLLPALLGLTLVGPLGCAGQKAQAKTETGPAEKKEITRAPASCTEEGRTDDVQTADVDGDGRPDIFKYYQDMDDPEKPGERKRGLTRQDIDINWDGTIDVCRFFDGVGRVSREELDLDYDTKIDERSTFEEGVVVVSERDRNNDGRADVIRRYKDGKLVQKETDTNDDGEVDRWEYYDTGKLDRVGVDFDFDGKVDRWSKAVARAQPEE